MSVQAIAWAWRHSAAAGRTAGRPGLTSTERLVLLRLADYADSIAEACGCSMQAAEVSLRTLESAGLVRRADTNRSVFILDLARQA